MAWICPRFERSRSHRYFAGEACQISIVDEALAEHSIPLRLDADAYESQYRCGSKKVVIAEPDHGLSLGFGVSALVTLREVERAKERAARAMLLDPENANLNYNLACSMAKLGELDQAIRILAPVLQAAQPQNLNWLKVDSDLDPIRDDPRFKAMVARAEARLAKAAPPGAA